MSTNTKNPSINIVAKYVYQETGHTEITIRARLRDGRFRNFTTERTIIAEPRTLYKFLVSRNARIPYDYKTAKGYLEEVVTAENVKATPVARRCGMFEGTYLTPHHCYGKNPAVQIRNLPEEKQEIALGMKAGDLPTFLKIIRPLVSKSRKLRLLLGAQCASILADIVDIGQPMIFHLGGTSGLGKTALIRIAMAIVGRANESDPKTYAATEAGLEDYFAFYRNSLTVIDEMGVASDEPRELLKKVQGMAFLFSSGKGRQLSRAYFEQTGKSQRTWAQLGVSSGEKTLKDLQAEAGRKLIDGVLRRMVDIPVTKSETVFDIGKEDQKLTAEEVLKELIETCEALKQHHGVALEPFALWINKNDSLRARFAEIKEGFVKSFKAQSGWHHAVVNHFAVCCAGGIMGIRAGIIPCSEDSYVQSIKKLCHSSITYTTKPSDFIESLSKRLFDAIENRDLVARRSKSGTYPKFDSETSLGFVRKRNGKNVAMIIAARLSEFLEGKHAAQDLADYLEKKKVIILGSGGKRTQPVDLPDGSKQVRCYRIGLET